MLVTVFCAMRDRPETTFALDVSPELELRDFVALCELESGIPADEIQVLYVEQPLKDPTRALGTYGVKDGDVVVLRQAERRPPPTQPAFPGLPHIDFRSITVPGTSSSTSQGAVTRQPLQAPPQPPPQQRPQQPSSSMAFRGSGSSPQGLDDPALLQEMLLSNPHELSLLKERNPPLAEALLSGDLERFTKVLLEQQQDRARREQERIRLLTADPFDLEAQAKIEEDIRQHNVEENMTIAMEEAPESFGQVVMLYINCKVNGHPVKAFVDSGAQMTIMSQACAERCNIMRLVDRRWAGIAKGVGTQKIIGRVHLAQVQIEGDFLPCSFSILEDQPMDMLLGLDMLKRHQCSIDLKKSVLLIGTTGTETRFLPEAELPECARLAYGAEGREDARPEEIADRELAEALQRSIQESDTADGQTTSSEPPSCPLPTPLDEIPPSQTPSFVHPQSMALDRSQSAPDTMQQAQTPGQCQSQPDFQGLTGPLSQAEDAASELCRVHPNPLPAPANSILLPIPTPSTEDLPQSIPPVHKAVSGTPTFEDPEDGVPPPTTEINTDSEVVENNCMLSETEELSPIQPMEQEVGESSTSTQTCLSASGQQSREEEERHEHLHQLLPNPPSPNPQSSPADSASLENTAVIPDLCTAEMGSPVASQGPVLSDRDQPEGEHCPSSDSIPSLAAALLELHQLLVSNSHARSQDRSTSCSPLHAIEQNADVRNHSPATEPCVLTPENTHPSSSTAITAGAEPSDAKANYAALPNKGPSECPVPGLSAQEEYLCRDVAETVEGEEPQQCPDSSLDMRADSCGQDDANNVTISEPNPAAISALAGDFEFRELPEELQGRGFTGGRASGTATPDTTGHQPELTLQTPLPMAEGSPEVSNTSVPSVLPLTQAPRDTSPAPPHPFTEQFPAEHIQRIQAAGFSAREAADALEQAHGIVELALLALLARNITVPT